MFVKYFRTATYLGTKIVRSNVFLFCAYFKVQHVAMALLQYLMPHKDKDGLPHQKGSLVAEIPGSAIDNANAKVKKILWAPEAKKKQGTYKR